MTLNTARDRQVIDVKVNDALRESRGRTNRSQEFMALELGVARKTIQNWEKGSSEPTIEQAIQWFRVLGISPLPYLFQIVFPDMERISSSDEEAKLRRSLEDMIDELPMEAVRQLLYLFYGDHGSSPRAVLNMLTAHLQTPMASRVSQGSVILKNYEMAVRRNELSDSGHIQPNTELLKEAINRGMDAAVNNDGAYIMGDRYSRW